MSIWQRALYAVVFVAVLNAIALLTLALAAPEAMVVMLKEMHWFVFVELAIVFPFAHMLNRYIPRKRDNGKGAI
jgi:hypothetical protein